MDFIITLIRQEILSPVIWRDFGTVGLIIYFLYPYVNYSRNFFPLTELRTKDLSEQKEWQVTTVGTLGRITYETER